MKKLKAIWHEIIERWFLLTFYGQRMERERLQILAELVKRKETLWKNIPAGIPRTIKDIVTYKEPKKKNINELVEQYEKKSPIIRDALYEALKNIQQKENDNTKKKETESERN
jgi:ABC-type transporter lipoprotein component MlaA